MSTIRPYYDMWPQYNRRLRDVIAVMTDAQLAIRPAPYGWPIWATVGHNATLLFVHHDKKVPTNQKVKVDPDQAFSGSQAWANDAQVALQQLKAGQSISNLAIVKLNVRRLQVKLSAGHARILMDVSGYFTS